MAHTIFILGTDLEHCQELRQILQERTQNTVVTTPITDSIPKLQKSDTVIITSEEQNTGILYRHLLNKLDDQDRRAQFLSELIRLFSSSLQLEDIIQKVVAKSTTVLGDTAFIILNAEGRLRLEAAYSTDRDRLVQMLVTVVNVDPHTLASSLLSEVLEDGQTVVIESLQKANVPGELLPLTEKYGLRSLIATPIRTKERILGAFVSVASAPQELGERDVATATDLSDFTAIALENARLFAELQRSAITDPLTGIYNARFFNEILAREAARAQRYGTALSLLMIDVDGFKTINDSFGHLVGNRVLTHLARVLERAIRNTDFVFRCGGDEFGVILPGTETAGAMRAAEKIIQKVQTGQILQTLGYSGSVTVSIGVSEYQLGNHFETLVAEADQALYASKRSSKNCVRAFSRIETGTT